MCRCQRVKKKCSLDRTNFSMSEESLVNLVNLLNNISKIAVGRKSTEGWYSDQTDRWTKVSILSSNTNMD